MTNPNLTEVVFLIDRSGSMVSIADDMIGGMKTFVEDQKKLPDPCVVSVYQFDQEYQMVFEERPLPEVPELVLEPRGSTALLDAMGRTINAVGIRLNAKLEQQRPGKLVFVVVTDGFENASHEFTKLQVKDMVEKQKTDYNWQFAFMGANIDSFAEAGGIGIGGSTTMNYAASAQGVASAYDTFSRSVKAYRSATTPDASLSFDQKDEDEDKKDEEEKE
jgi:hypothetical protein